MILRDSIGLRKVKEDVGIEIEIEGKNNFPREVNGWTSHADGSLRGNSIEYVSKPIYVKDVKKNLDVLRKELKDYGTIYHYSMRAGVHVHVNCQELTKEQMYIFACCYYILEKPLIDFCGDDRVGNLFCLRACDAEYVVQTVIQSLKDDDLLLLNSDQIRYCSLNYSSLFKFGTLEFRALATLPNFEKIEEWAIILVNLRDWSLKFKNLESIVEYFSEVGPELFAKEALGKYYNQIVPGDLGFIDFVDGMRTTQEIVNYRYM